MYYGKQLLGEVKNSDIKRRVISFARCRSPDDDCTRLKGFVLHRAGATVIPGSLGAQDGGNLLLRKAFGYSDVAGITFALFRCFRELVWIGVGLIALAVVGRRLSFLKEDTAS